MDIKAIVIFCLTLYNAPLLWAQTPPPISHQFYHQYDGDFYFDDSSYITGGPSDEIKGSLLYIDPLSLSRGGVFQPIDSFQFQSLIDKDVHIKFSTNIGGDIVGLWWQSKNEAPLYAKKKNSPKVEQVQFSNGDITLAGELYWPSGADKKLPLIIQVHGSGRQGRHAGPWNTFALQQGIAVLSYDKRGVGASGGQYASAGYLDLASDLLAAIAFAKKMPGVDTTKIGLHASSEGGWVASIAAAAKPGLAFILVRAGSGVSGSDTYMYEVKNELKEKQLRAEEYLQAIVFEQTVQDMAARSETLEAVNAYIHQIRKANTWFEKAFGNYKEISAAYWIKLKQSGKIDPVVYLRKVNAPPVLWFLAEEDENVPYEISKHRLLEAFNTAGNKSFELVSLPKARHSFLVFSNDGVHYSPGYWSRMIGWLKEIGISGL